MMDNVRLAEPVLSRDASREDLLLYYMREQISSLLREDDFEVADQLVGYYRVLRIGSTGHTTEELLLGMYFVAAREVGSQDLSPENYVDNYDGDERDDELEGDDAQRAWDRWTTYNLAYVLSLVSTSRGPR